MQLAFDFDVDTRGPAAGADGPGGRRAFGHVDATGFPVRAQGRRNYYFFAILPERAAAVRIDEVARGLRRDYGLAGRLIGIERYHVSLHGYEPPDEWAADLIACMKQAADMISAPSFALCFDQALSFSRQARTHPFVLTSSDELPALNALHAALGRAISSAGLPVARSFTPHLTLFYDTRLLPVTAVRHVRWTAHDFALIRSLRGLSRYEELGRWQLEQAKLQPGDLPSAGDGSR